TSTLCRFQELYNPHQVPPHVATSFSRVVVALIYTAASEPVNTPLCRAILSSAPLPLRRSTTQSTPWGPQQNTHKMRKRSDERRLHCWVVVLLKMSTKEVSSVFSTVKTRKGFPQSRHQDSRTPGHGRTLLMTSETWIRLIYF
uniref:Uncharacterized protein n=1 Tax=Cyclopterus lumpus TaxID=8103 RepID=A0A8C2W7D3_CYCLU